MDKYEVLYIIRGDVDDDKKNQVVEKFENLVSTLGGTVDGLDKWGMRKFAYEINKETYYEKNSSIGFGTRSRRFSFARSVCCLQR